MIKYWHYEDFESVMDMNYITIMMLNATIPSSDTTGSAGSSASSGPISFFDFGKQLAGIK